MAKYLFNRYIWLVDVIYRSGNITFEEINRQWKQDELSKGESLPLRTFHNHKDAIAELFGIHIGCNKRNGYVYFIESKNAIANSSIQSQLFNTLSINNWVCENPQMKERVFWENIPSGYTLLRSILEAMKEGRSIEIRYKSVWRNYVDTFEIEPYCVKVFQSNWYLIARDPYLDKIRIYTVDWIESLRRMERKFKISKTFQLEKFLKHNFGMQIDESIQAEVVRIKADDNMRKYLRSLPLHASQEEIEIRERKSVFQYFLAPTLDFSQKILSFGAAVEVIWPPSFREDFAKMVRSVRELYK